MKQPERPPDYRKIIGENQEDIFKYLDMEEVQNFVNRMNNKYYSWDEFKYKDIESFLGNLDDLPLIYKNFNILIDSLDIRRKS